ncbi:MAG: alpha-beta hydrolase superfamily lysophospholipase [Marivirga sp.]|jgi:alpha-beta hydrolase superfamily lysophospholipase
MIQFESHFVDKNNYKLHYKRIFKHTDGPALMLIHGSIEDGRIFYSKSGKGLAPFLAEQGFDVFVVDLRGKGLSVPSIDASSNFGQKEAIMEDMPNLINGIHGLSGKKPVHIIAHSWGGVITLSYLARFSYPELKGVVFFGSKRDVRVQSPKRWLNVDLLWNLLGTYLVHKYGFLPAVKYKAGSDNESKNFFLEANKWVYSKEWIDAFDGFNYATALQDKKLPPILSITGAKDTHAGHPKDVKRLLSEIGNKASHQFKEIGTKQGYLNNYDHITLLTHPDAKDDHFKEVATWLHRHS